MYGSDTVTVTRKIRDKYAHQIFETRQLQTFTGKPLENSRSKKKKNNPNVNTTGNVHIT
jgi:hypothetical protein